MAGHDRKELRLVGRSADIDHGPYLTEVLSADVRRHDDEQLALGYVVGDLGRHIFRPEQL